MPGCMFESNGRGVLIMPSIKHAVHRWRVVELRGCRQQPILTAQFSITEKTMAKQSRVESRRERITGHHFSKRGEVQTSKDGLRWSSTFTNYTAPQAMSASVEEEKKEEENLADVAFCEKN